MAAATVACHARAAPQIRGVKPSAFNKAGPVGDGAPKRRGEPEPTTAPAARPTARMTGVEPMLRY